MLTVSRVVYPAQSISTWLLAYHDDSGATGTGDLRRLERTIASLVDAEIDAANDVCGLARVMAIRGTMRLRSVRARQRAHKMA